MTVLLNKRKIIYLSPMKTGSATLHTALKNLKDDTATILRKDNPPYYSRHHAWYEVKDEVGTDIWNEWYKIGSVRNPWDTIVSLYYYNIQTKDVYLHNSFREFVLSNNWFGSSSSNILFDNNILQVDDVIKLEIINEDFKRMFGVSCDYYENKGTVRTDSDYKHMYDDKTAEHVYDICYNEIREFGYTYD